jgi:hypothetical protein
MARLGGERKEGEVMTTQPKSDRDHFVEVVDPEFKLPLHVYYACLSGWNERAVIARQEVAAKDAVIAELVGLLRRVDDAGLNLLACDLMEDIKAAIALLGG